MQLESSRRAATLLANAVLFDSIATDAAAAGADVDAINARRRAAQCREQAARHTARAIAQRATPSAMPTSATLH